MKVEPQLTLDTKERIELNIKKKQEIEYVLQGSVKPQPGHFVWEVNEVTGEIKKAQFKRNTAVYGAELPTEELVVKSDCIYIPALNAENAKRKYLKNKEQSAYYVKPAPMSLSDITFK